MHFPYAFSVKAAFNTLRQYIHLFSNTTVIAQQISGNSAIRILNRKKGIRFHLGFIKISNQTLLKHRLKYIIKELKITWIINPAHTYPESYILKQM